MRGFGAGAVISSNRRSSSLHGPVGPKLGFRPSLEACSCWVFLPAFSCRKSGRKGRHPQNVRSLWVSAPTFSIRSATWPVSQLRADQAFLALGLPPLRRAPFGWRSLDGARPAFARQHTWRVEGRGRPGRCAFAFQPVDRGLPMGAFFGRLRLAKGRSHRAPPGRPDQPQLTRLRTSKPSATESPNFCCR